MRTSALMLPIKQSKAAKQKVCTAPKSTRPGLGRQKIAAYWHMDAGHGLKPPPWAAATSRHKPALHALHALSRVVKHTRYGTRRLCETQCTHYVKRAPRQSANHSLVCAGAQYLKRVPPPQLCNAAAQLALQRLPQRAARTHHHAAAVARARGGLRRRGVSGACVCVT